MKHQSSCSSTPPLLARTILCCALAALTTQRAPAMDETARERPRAGYTLTYDPSTQPPRWVLELAVHGLDPKRKSVVLALSDWGNWPDFDAYVLTSVTSVPSAAPQSPNAFELKPPDDWDGSVRMKYTIACAKVGSNLQRHHSLIPVWSTSYSAGFSTNTLMRVLVDGKAVELDRSIEIVTPAGWTVFTGWSGVLDRRGPIRFADAAGNENAIIAFGKPAGVARASQDGIDYEVAQFGDTPDVAAAVLKIVQTLSPAYARTTGKAPDRPVRVLLSDNDWGGTRVDYGLRVGFRTDMPKGYENAPDFIRMAAHEFFHDWLGGHLKPADDSLVWFFEGFTEYMATWHCAATGLASREWFVDRIVEMDRIARRSPAYGHTAFGDASVSWRDGDGPNETLAYHASPLLAFCLDVELRRNGRAGIGELIGDFIRQNKNVYSLTDIIEWFESHGMSEFAERYVKQPFKFELKPWLEAIGCEQGLRDAPLTYFGIRCDKDVELGRVEELDPDGPAAKAGVVAGDIITGYCPTRASRPEIAASVKTPFRFGLNCFDPDSIESTFIGVRRGKQELRFDFKPQIIPGGMLPKFAIKDEAKCGKFFGAAR